MKITYIFVIIATFLLTACSAETQTNVPAANSIATSTQPQVTLLQPQATQVQPQTTPIQSTAPANLPSAPSLSPEEVYQAVSAAWEKMGTAGPRHISQTTNDGLSTEADVVPPDFHQVVSIGGNIVAEQYIVSDTIYANEQGAWTQTAGGGNSLLTVGDFAMGLADNLEYSDGIVVGVEEINGSPAIIYSYSTTLKGLDASAQYKLWVDQISGLPVRSVNVGSDGMTIDETITYNNSLTITLPSEAKNAPTATD